MGSCQNCLQSDVKNFKWFALTLEFCPPPRTPLVKSLHVTTKPTREVRRSNYYVMLEISDSLSKLYELVLGRIYGRIGYPAIFNNLVDTRYFIKMK